MGKQAIGKTKGGFNGHVLKQLKGRKINDKM